MANGSAMNNFMINKLARLEYKEERGGVSAAPARTATYGVSRSRP